MDWIECYQYCEERIDDFLEGMSLIEKVHLKYLCQEVVKISKKISKGHRKEQKGMTLEERFVHTGKSGKNRFNPQIEAIHLFFYHFYDVPYDEEKNWYTGGIDISDPDNYERYRNYWFKKKEERFRP